MFTANLKRFCVHFLLAAVLCVSAVVSFNTAVLASPIAPTTTSATDASQRLSGKIAQDQARNQDQAAANKSLPGKLEEIKETVVEKLNLNEPLPESTKEFLNEVEQGVEKTVEPITGEPAGYYNSAE